MPIHVYQCTNCGNEVERITTSIATQMPPRIQLRCCNGARMMWFAKVVRAPSVITPTTTKTARRDDYRRKNPNWKENVISGKTADGRPVQKNALQRRSQEAWGNAFANSHPSLDKDRAEVDSKRGKG